MAGIKHLYDIYNKKGKDFINDLFNSYVTVNEKMDGSSFNFERNKKSGSFEFYKRNQKTPITLVDRTLSKYYEKPINYIESLPPHVINKIPKGWRFGLEYFSNKNPVEITYDRLPKNHLILSYIHEKNDRGEITKSIENKEELDNWADLLGVERPPIIFQGKLKDSQINEILDFLNTPFKELVETYKTNSFVSFILGVLNPELKNTALNNDTEKDIEGIVFRFGEIDSDDEGEVFLAKMVDPVFTEVAKEKAKNSSSRKPSDFLGITLLDVMNFILQNGIDSFKVKGKSEDERYISFISDVFSKFVKEHSDKYEDADFEEPEYLKKEEFRLNSEMIKDKRVESILKKSESFESLFKLILNSFRKIRKRSGGIISEEVLEQFNKLVKEINSYISVKDETEVSESEVPSFSGFKETYSPSDKVEYLTEEGDDDDSDDIFYSFNQFITALETIEDKSEPNISENKKGDRRNLIIGRFQPFHKGHLKMVEKLKEHNGLPCHIAVVNPGHNKSGNSPFSKKVVTKYMDKLKDEHEDISDYTIHRNGFLGNILTSLSEKNIIISCLGSGPDRMGDYRSQEKYLKKSKSIDVIDESFEIVETPRITSGKKVRDLIKSGDFTSFKKEVTPEISSLYNMLESEIKSSLNESHNSYGIKSRTIFETIEQIQDLSHMLSPSGTNSDNKKNIEKMKKIIKDFEGFLSTSSRFQHIEESDGFGTLPFLKIGKGDVQNYMFNLESEEGKDRGFLLAIGKYSEYEPIDGPKNSFCVLNLNEVSPEVIEDISMKVGKIPQLNKEQISLSDNEKSRLMKMVFKCILDYLENHPKIVRIYDELQDNLDFGDDYLEYTKSMINTHLGNEWSSQETDSDKMILYLR